MDSSHESDLKNRRKKMPRRRRMEEERRSRIKRLAKEKKKAIKAQQAIIDLRNAKVINTSSGLGYDGVDEAPKPFQSFRKVAGVAIC